MTINPKSVLQSITREFKVDDIASIVLNHPKFETASGSGAPDNHHYGMGGLAQHTLEVVELCIRTNEYLATLDKAVNNVPLILSAVFHDIGKTEDYEPVDVDMKVWRKATHSKTIHHISKGGLVWHDAVTTFPNYKHLHDEVLHAILAHHGQKEWGSPVTPVSKTAWILHLCDSISARIDDLHTKFTKSLYG